MTLPEPGEPVLLMALRILERGERFASQVRESLVRQGVDPSECNAVVEKLMSWGYLDDTRAAGRLAERRGTRQGVLAIEHELERMGVPPATSASVLGPLRESEVDRAIGVGRTKVALGKTRAQVGRFLAGRGFEPDAIESALGRLFLDEAGE